MKNNSIFLVFIVTLMFMSNAFADLKYSKPHNEMIFDCGTFNFFEQSIADEKNCFGIYWLRNGKEYVPTYPHKGGVCRAKKLKNRSKSIERSFVKDFCETSKLPSDLNIEKMKKTIAKSETREKLLVRLRNILDWTYCVDVNKCSKDPATGTAQCQKDDLALCRNFNLTNDVHLAYVNDSTCPGNCEISGDMTYGMSFACLAGEQWACWGIRQGQDRKGEFGPKGAWYRNPIHKLTHHWNEKKVLFSRDQSLGVMSYILVTKDLEAAQLWLEFIAKNKKMDKGLSYNLCPSKEGTKIDDRCRVMPSNWAEWATVLEAAGYNLNNAPRGVRELLQLAKYSKIAIPIMQLSKYFVRKRTPGAFESSLLNLVAILFSRSGDKDFTQLFRYFDKRAYSMNPWINFYANRKILTEYNAWQLMNYCPSIMPDYNTIEPTHGILNFSEALVRPSSLMTSTQGYQYFMGVDQEGHFRTASAHECVAMIRTVLQ